MTGYLGKTTNGFGYIRGELGARFEHSIALDDGKALRLNGRAAWAINSNADRHVIASFNSLPGSSAFRIDGAAPDASAALIDVGGALDFGNGLTASVNVNGEFFSNVRNYGARAKLSLEW